MAAHSFDVNIIDFKGKGGPSIVITGAVHGNEQTGTYSAELVAERLKNEEIIGDIRIIPVCNESAFKARQRPAIEDDVDLNRIFPGDKQGGYSEQLAAYIWDITGGFDYLLDLHCCGLYGSEYTMCWYSKYDFQMDLCKKLGIKNVIHTAGTGGQLYLEACGKRGQKSLLVELPGGQPGGVINMDSALDTCEKVINYLRLIGVIAGEGVMPEGVNLCGVIDKEGIKAEEDGVYTKCIEPGSLVKKGDIIAKVNGKAYVAPYDAVITSASIDRYVFKDDRLVGMAPSKQVQPGEV